MLKEFMVIRKQVSDESVDVFDDPFFDDLAGSDDIDSVDDLPEPMWNQFGRLIQFPIVEGGRGYPEDLEFNAFGRPIRDQPDYVLEQGRLKWTRHGAKWIWKDEVIASWAMTTGSVAGSKAGSRAGSMYRGSVRGSTRGSQRGAAWEYDSQWGVDDEDDRTPLGSEDEELGSRRGSDSERTGGSRRPQSAGAQSYYSEYSSWDRRSAYTVGESLAPSEWGRRSQFSMFEDDRGFTVMTKRDPAEYRSQAKQEKQRVKLTRRSVYADLKSREPTLLVRFRLKLFRLSETARFQNVVVLAILLNCAVLSLDDFPARSKTFRVGLIYANLGFFAVFLLEALLLHFAYGVKLYWLKFTTFFDGVVLLAAGLELVFGWLGNGSLVPVPATAFRGLRLVMVLSRWRACRSLIKSVLRTLGQFANFALLLLIVIYIFALLGQSLFAAQFVFDPDTGEPLTNCIPHSEFLLNQEYCYAKCSSPLSPTNLFRCLPRAHYDDFYTACVSIFMLLSGDSWETQMWNGMKSRGPAASMFFVSVLAIGVFVVLNVFLAILVSSFGVEQELDKELLKREEFKKKKKSRALVEVLKEQEADEARAKGLKGFRKSLMGNVMGYDVDYLFIRSCYTDRVASSQKIHPGSSPGRIVPGPST